jgi:hypothetical protein
MPRPKPHTRALPPLKRLLCRECRRRTLHERTLTGVPARWVCPCCDTVRPLHR